VNGYARESNRRRAFIETLENKRRTQGGVQQNDLKAVPAALTYTIQLYPPQMTPQTGSGTKFSDGSDYTFCTTRFLTFIIQSLFMNMKARG